MSKREFTKYPHHVDPYKIRLFAGTTEGNEHTEYMGSGRSSYLGDSGTDQKIS